MKSIKIPETFNGSNCGNIGSQKRSGSGHARDKHG